MPSLSSFLSRLLHPLRPRRTSPPPLPTFHTVEAHAVIGPASAHLLINPTTGPHAPVRPGDAIVLNHRPARVLHVEGPHPNGVFRQGDPLILVVTPLPDHERPPVPPASSP
jgi:hypothetical protein